MSSTERPSKRHAFLALLREGWTSVHLDARRPGVVVPPNLKREAHLVLQYGHDLPIPIPDLEVDDYGVRATLSFSRTAHLTVVPWSAVYVVACDDGRGVLYTEDVPNDVAVISATAKGQADAGAPDSDPDVAVEDVMLPVPRASRLRSIPADAAPGDAAMTAEAAEMSVGGPIAAPRRRRRPQLRLVK
jgi:stringent starvation protein B